MTDAAPRPGPECARHARAIDALIVGELAPRHAERLREHVAVCAHCRARYDRAVLAARLLCGGPAALDAPAAPELERVRERLLGRARLTPDPGWRRVGLRLGLALAGAAAALAIAVPLALREARPPAAPEALQARGAATRQGPQVGLRTLCIHEAAGAKPRLREMPPDGSGACGIDGALSFAYTNRSGLKQLFLFGVDEGQTVHWYLPRPPAERSAPIAGDVVDEPLPRTVRLAANHKPGALRIFALFSAGPISGDQVRRAVAGLRARGAALEAQAPLPLAGTEQRSLLVRLLPTDPDGAALPLKLDGPGSQKPGEN